MIALLVAAALAVAPPAPPAPPVQPAPLSEADHAIASGRLDQARIMIGKAIQAGVHGPQLDRLLADLAFASSDFAIALIRYEALLAIQPGEPLFAERIGVAAIHQGNLAKAASALKLATAAPLASWRAWNARGVLADLRGDWIDADRSYARATRAKPNAPEVLNNQAWSLLLRGQWQSGLALLEQAAVLDPHVTRIANNLELARTAVSENLPQRRADESAENWAARLNDAGIVADLRGQRKQAIAAFAQAIMANNVWFERAANNLALAEAEK
ncbi:tetratricopeptide repeat protein [Sphingomonas sp.]|uniref:tetratricopeptide repeat protein n=1 Tax=Sphingomonas sp. TaxID=28214 RepID=UPI00286A88F9|nr:tetratricopeptide repeat protein [Sphingomonas sp.]